VIDKTKREASTEDPHMEVDLKQGFHSLIKQRPSGEDLVGTPQLEKFEEYSVNDVQMSYQTNCQNRTALSQLAKYERSLFKGSNAKLLLN
jgi:hypothetical protein